MMPDVPGLPNLANLIPRLPSLGLGRSRPSVEDEIETLPESQRLFLLGADPAEVERAKQYEQLYGPTGLRPIAAGLGVEPPAQKRGLLESFADYATRLQSASTGFLTGLTGMERLRETRDERGISDGRLFDRPESAQAGLGLALERFAQGISGQEKFQAADFGALAYDRETAGTGERFLKSAAGFVLDVAVDPLTYLSLGGSILGRRLAASAVNRVARKNADSLIGTLDDATKLTVIRNGILREGTDDIILTNTVRQVAPDLAPATGLMATDDALRALATKPGALNELAADAMAHTAAGIYRSFGPGGLFRYMSDEFGQAGVQFWRQLPNDLKGGIRIRVPLSGMYRRMMGRTGEFGGAVPAAIRIPGTGTGRISRALGTDRLNNATRSWFRSKRLLRGGADELSGTTGASNMATAEAIYRRNVNWQKAVTGEFDPKVDPKLRSISWRATEEAEDAVRLLRAGAMSSAQRLIAPLREATAAYRQGRELGGAEFDDLFDVAIRGNLQDFRSGAQTLEEALGIVGREATEVEQLAYTSAAAYQYLLRDVEAQLAALKNDYAGFNPNFLENYWPRIMDDIEKELGGRPMSAAFGNLRGRTHFVAEFNEDGTVARWMTPKEISAQLGSPMFIEDAEKLMTTYLTSMNKFLQEERFFQSLLDRGVLFRGGSEALGQVADITAASRAWQEGYNTLVAGRAALRGLGRGRYADALTGEGLTGPALQAQLQEAQRVAAALQAARLHGPRLYQQYSRVGMNVLRSADGTTITGRDAAATTLWDVSRMRAGRREYLTEKGRWTTNFDEAAAYWDEGSAVAAADGALTTDRARDFIGRVEELRVEFLKDVNRAIANRGTMQANGLNPLNPVNITPANQEDFFAAIADVINKYGKDEGLQSRFVVAKAYRNQKFGAGRGAAVSPAALGSDSGPRVRAFWQNRMERLGIFAPQTIVDDVRRIFAAYDNPKGMKKWIDDWYRPFYAAQKALMTSQRGPGYVLRNISGGLWNAYLVGTTARHWRLAGVLKVAEQQARRVAQEQAPDDLAQQGVIASREAMRILKSKLGDRRGQRAYESMMAFERRGLRGMDLTSKSRGTADVSDGSPTAALRRPLDEDEMNFAQRASQKITDDWWWAKTMGRATRESEDFLRLASFIRGVDMYGLDDGGRAAALMVKATQFDYADLSAFEADTLKMIVPFYTWTRNNVPLQFRAMMHEPGKVARAVRLNDALADAFGEPEDPEEPLPAYVRERFGWKIREDLVQGPMGDALSAGMVVGEPLSDVNRLFGSATGVGPVSGPASMLNWRELANQMNPIIGVGAEALTGMERSTGGRLPREEEAPRWLDVIPGVGRETDEGTMVSARALRAARELLPPLGIVERYAAPLLGNERMQRRWYTTLASAIFGLPVSTLDPYQTGAELRAQEQRLRGGLERQFGGDLTLRTSYVRRVLREGATPEEMEVVIKQGLLGGREISEVPVEELDETAMVDTLRFMRRMIEMREQGVPQETLNLMMDYFKPRTDAERGVRSGKTPPLTPEQLATLGETPASVASMSPDERLALLRRWIGENPDWGTALR
jgi:hypothetical protein